MTREEWLERRSRELRAQVKQFQNSIRVPVPCDIGQVLYVVHLGEILTVQVTKMSLTGISDGWQITAVTLGGSTIIFVISYSFVELAFTKVSIDVTKEARERGECEEWHNAFIGYRDDKAFIREKDAVAYQKEYKQKYL